MVFVLLYLITVIPLQWILNGFAPYIAWGNLVFLLHIVINLNSGFYRTGSENIVRMPCGLLDDIYNFTSVLRSIWIER